MLINYNWLQVELQQIAASRALYALRPSEQGRRLAAGCRILPSRQPHSNIFVLGFFMLIYTHCAMPYSEAHKSRKYCFTFFWDVDEFGPRGPGRSLFENWNCEYLYVGLEICPTTERPHYQGYVRFTNTRAKNGVMKLFPKPHKINANAVNACCGTEAQNIKYCSKDDDLIIEWGTPEGKDETKAQGKRTDIDDGRDMIKQGVSKREIIKTCQNQ